MDMRVLPQAVHTVQHGAGDRDVLAIHCTLAHSGAWRGVIKALDDVARVTAFDLLSHGRSPDWDGQGDYQDRTVEIAETLLSRPMDVVGHSFGATVALRLAAACPDRVRSLTLIEPVYFCFAQQTAPDVVAAHQAEAAPLWAMLERGEVETAARTFNAMWSDVGPGWDQLPDVARASMVRGIPIVPASQRALFDDPMGLSAPGGLDAVRMPVLLLRGSRTQPVIAAVNAALETRLPDVRSVVVEGAGHMLPITHPRAVAEPLRALFAATPV